MAKKQKSKEPYYEQTAKDYIDEGFVMTRALKKRHKNITPKGLTVKGSRLLANDSFNSTLRRVLEGKEDKIDAVLKQGLEANRVTEHKGKAKLTNTPDYAERRKTAGLILSHALPKTTINRDIKTELKLKIKDLNTKELEELLK